MKLRTCALIAILTGSSLAALLSVCLPNGMFLNSWPVMRLAIRRK
jgi:hypothetical protein